MKHLILICLSVTALGVAACGESKQEKAQKQVCSARADIQKQVSQLQGMTAATATANGVKDSLNAIKSDLRKIKDAQPQLSSERKEEVQSANDEFVSEFNSVVAGLPTDLSISGAKAKLSAATQQLAAAYRSAYAKVNCSS